MSAMSVSHDATSDVLAARLRERGLRMTPQRQSVMRAVELLEHATPEQVAEAVPEVDVTTVYRTLETLERIGMLSHTHLGHGAPSYRMAEDDHVHVICHRCAAVIDADPRLADGLARTLRESSGFILDRSHFTVFGMCADCAEINDEDTMIEAEGSMPIHPVTRRADARSADD
jgi:Fur family transcriptional regulator, ferric uptake regulator